MKLKLFFTMLVSWMLMLPATVMAQDITPMPLIDVDITDEEAIIFAYGEGEVHLFLDGTEVENPYIFTRTYEEAYLLFNAYAQADGMAMSDWAEKTVIVPALEQPVTPVPVIDYFIDDEQVFVIAYGEGEVHLFLDGTEVENPYYYPRSYEEEYLLFTAYAQGGGMLMSDWVEMTVVVPALEPIEPTPAPQINVNYSDHGYVEVYFFDADPDATIYYSFSYDDQGFSEWMVYDDLIIFDQEGLYYIRAYAVSFGRTPSEIVEAAFTVTARKNTVNPLAYAHVVDEQGLRVHFIGDPYYYYLLIPELNPEDYSWPQYCEYSINDGSWNTVDINDYIYLPDYGDYTITFRGFASGHHCSDMVTAVVHYDADNYYSVCHGQIVYNGLVYSTFSDGTACVVSQYYPLAVPYFYLEYEGDVVIPEVLSIQGRDYTVTTIQDEAFGWHSNITGLTIPKTVTNIGSGIFLNGCTCLTLKVEDGNPVYDSRDNCNAIIETASNTLIQGCQGTVIPGTVTAIGSNAFRITDIVSIDIPNSVTSIGNYAFYNCPLLEEVNISNSVTSIGERAFGECRRLVHVNIPTSLTTISGQMFFGCSALTEITIPNSVTSIGNTAFYDCRNLSRMTSLAMTPPGVGSDVFSCTNGENLYEQVTLFVPEDAVVDYRGHDEWGKFSHIVPFVGAGPGDVDGNGTIGINDVTTLIDQLLSSGDRPEWMDVTGDGSVDIADVTLLIDMLLNAD